jgi:glutathione S-transferase
MKLYGTTTSPFVRRVRVVADEVGEPIELVNTATDDGQAALLAISPIRKVPVAVLASSGVAGPRSSPDGSAEFARSGLAGPRSSPEGSAEGNAARTLFDSHVIIDWLVITRGWQGLVPARDRWREANLVNAIDAALDAAIQLFYLRRDGVEIAGSPYEVRQLARIDAIVAWLVPQLGSDGTSFGDGFGLAELALVTTLDWMDFRATYPTERAAALLGMRTRWRDRPSLAQTRPHT